MCSWWTMPADWMSGKASCATLCSRLARSLLPTPSSLSTPLQTVPSPKVRICHVRVMCVRVMVCVMRVCVCCTNHAVVLTSSQAHFLLLACCAHPVRQRGLFSSFPPPPPPFFPPPPPPPPSFPPEVLQDTAKRLADQRASEEGQVGLKSFFAKEPAPWTQKPGSS